MSVQVDSHSDVVQHSALADRGASHTEGSVDVVDQHHGVDGDRRVIEPVRDPVQDVTVDEPDALRDFPGHSVLIGDLVHDRQRHNIADINILRDRKL